MAFIWFFCLVLSKKKLTRVLCLADTRFNPNGSNKSNPREINCFIQSNTTFLLSDHRVTWSASDPAWQTKSIHNRQATHSCFRSALCPTAGSPQVGIKHLAEWREVLTLKEFVVLLFWLCVAPANHKQKKKIMNTNDKWILEFQGKCGASLDGAARHRIKPLASHFVAFSAVRRPKRKGSGSSNSKGSKMSSVDWRRSLRNGYGASKLQKAHPLGRMKAWGEF